MANGLTGEFDAVVQVSVETVNRLLGTMHQNGDSTDVSPSFPHSFTVRVGDVPDVFKTGLWAEAASLQVDSTGAHSAKAIPSSKAPPGARRAAEQALQELTATSPPHTTAQVGVEGLLPGPASEAPGLTPTAKPVRGMAWVQLATPTVTFPRFSTSEVTAHLRFRAHYVPHPGTAAMPTPVHGEIRASFSIEPVSWSGGTTVLRLRPTTDDTKIALVPAQGTLSPLERGSVAEHIRHAIRTRFEPTSVELPAFRFLGFKAFSADGVEGIALPVDLSEGGPSVSLASVTKLFLGAADDFAVAISRQYVESLVKPMLDELKGFHRTYTVSTTVPVFIVIAWFPVTVSRSYDVSVSSVSLTWQTGKIRLTVIVRAIGQDPLPDYPNITVEQELKLALNPTTQALSLERLGDLSITNLPSAIAGKAKSAMEQQRDAAIAKANQQIDTALTGAVAMDDILASLDASGSASSAYTSVSIREEGVVLRGTISLPPRPPVVVHFSETTNGLALTAFKSWIPAGTIDRYVWEWQRVNEFADMKGHHLAGPPTRHQAFHDDHGFLMPVPAELPADGWICLRVEGTQIPASGGPEYPVSGEACQLLWPPLRLTLPAAWQAVMPAPLWGPSDAQDAVLETTLIGHVNAFSPSRMSAAPGLNTIVHFADVHSGRPLDTIGRALLERSVLAAQVAIVVVLPLGTFRGRRSAVTETLGPLRTHLPGYLVITEDYESAWTRTFGVRRPPTTFLIDGRGDVVWQGEDLPDARALAAALDRHATVSPRPPSRAVRVAARPGALAPDVLLCDARGERLALRKLRGRRVMLTFWKSWSAPCLATLDHLQQVSESVADTGPLILAVNDGEDPQRCAEVRRERKLTLTLIPDPQREISRRYGVECWPTTISIDERGRVDGVHVGMSHGGPRNADIHGRGERPPTPRPAARPAVSAD